LTYAVVENSSQQEANSSLGDVTSSPLLAADDNGSQRVVFGLPLESEMRLKKAVSCISRKIIDPDHATLLGLRCCD
jgi:hypothetical protein